jgi:hypothetical protein
MPAPVQSVFGRIGAVVATALDYLTSQIANDSNAAGTTLNDAIDTLIALVNGVAAAAAPARLTVTAVNASRTLVAGDNNSVLECDSGSAIVLTVDGGVMSAGDVVPIAHKGAGAVSVAQGASGMVIVSKGDLFNTDGTGAYCALIFVTSTRAYFVGERA